MTKTQFSLASTKKRTYLISLLECLASNITRFSSSYGIKCRFLLCLSFIVRQHKMATGSSCLILYTVLIASEPAKMRISPPSFVTRKMSEYFGLPWLIYLFLGLPGGGIGPTQIDRKVLIPKEVLSRYNVSFFKVMCVL